MTKTETALLNGDGREELKQRVWEVAQEVMRRIEDGTLDEERIGNLQFALSIWMDDAGGGLCAIHPSDWKRLVETNDLTDFEIDAMVHVGLDYYFDSENTMEFWAEEEDDTD